MWAVPAPPAVAMPASRSGLQRRHTTNLSNSHAHPLASLPKPLPAAAPGYAARRLFDDIASAGLAGGLLQDPARAEITRLSAKTLELTAKLQVRPRRLPERRAQLVLTGPRAEARPRPPQAGDSERRHLDGLLDSARRECANMQARLTQLQREQHHPHSAPAPARAAPIPAAHPGFTESPQDGTDNEEALARCSLVEARAAPSARASSPPGETASPIPAAARATNGSRHGATSPPPGIVARLQADLQEAAEERRVARQQAHALRERVRELERALAHRGEVQRLEPPPPAPSAADELVVTNAALRTVEARAVDTECRLQISLGRQREQAQQLAEALRQRRRDAAEHIPPAEASAAAAAAAQLRALHSVLNAERTAAAGLARQVQLSEEAKRSALEHLRVAREEAARAAAAARSERIECDVQQRDALAGAQEQARAAAALAAGARAEAAEARAAAEAEAARRGGAESRLAAAVAEVSALEERLAVQRAEMEREAVRMSSQASQQHQQAEQQEAAAHRLRAELRQSQSEVDVARAELGARANQAEAMQLELEQLRARLEASQLGVGEREALISARATLAAEAAELRRQLRQVQGELEKLQAEAGRAAAEERRLSIECAELREGVATGLRGACDRALAQVTELTGRAEAERERADALSAQLKALEAAGAASAKRNQSLQKQLEQLQRVSRESGVAAQVDKLERELAAAKAARAEAEEKLEGAQAMVRLWPARI
eukprot:scaffold10425_cov114-Isochrysis_galbana.AAC.2